MESGILIITLLALLLVGCEGYKKIRDGGEIPKESPVVKKINTPKLLSSGVLTNDNFAEIDIPDYNKIFITIKRDEKILDVLPYSEKRDEEGKPYFIPTEGGLLFFNMRYGDEYEIRELN